MKITNVTTNTLEIDAIDIDSNAELLDKNIIDISEINLNKNSLSMEIGEIKRLTASISPANAENNKLTWTSSDSNVCTVDEYGIIEAVGEGNAIVTVSSRDGSNKSDSCTITVSDESNRALLNVHMSDGKIFSYDLNAVQTADFTNWFEDRSEGKGKSFYLIKTVSELDGYTSRTDCLKYDAILYYTVDTYIK